MDQLLYEWDAVEGIARREEIVFGWIIPAIAEVRSTAQVVVGGVGGTVQLVEARSEGSGGLRIDSNSPPV
jgi:hypothetical protein